MIVVLESRLAAEPQRTHIGAVHWQVFPVRYLLADASALVIDAVSKRLEHPINTFTDAKTVAEMTDARLNLGLELLYVTAERAADAFKTQVIDLLARAIGLGYRPGMTLSDSAWRALGRGFPAMVRQEVVAQARVENTGDLASFWRRPAYFFLVDAAKRGREEAEWLTQTYDKLMRVKLRFRKLNKVLPDVETFMADVLRVNGDTKIAGGRRHLPSLRTMMEEKLETLQLAVHLLTTTQMREETGYLSSDTGLLYGWINTTILRVGLGQPEMNGALSPEQAVEAQTRLRDMVPEHVVDGVWHEACRRVVSTGGKTTTRFEELVREHATWHLMLLVASPHPPALDRHIIDPNLASDATVGLTHDGALEYLMRDEGMEVTDITPDLMEAIERSLVWNTFDTDELTMLLEEHRIPVEMVLRHVQELHEGAQGAVVDWMLKNEPQHINALIELDVLAWDRKVLRWYATHLSSTNAERLLRDLLAHHEMSSGLVDTYLELMCLSNWETLREVWADASLHAAVLALTQWLVFDNGFKRFARDPFVLITRGGEPFAARALEVYAHLRAELYDSETAPADSERMPQWEETGRDPRTSWSMIQDFCKVFGSAKVAELVSDTSEEAAFRGYVSHERNAERRVATFLRNRERFYALPQNTRS
jgi:hypothetical protein